MRLNVQGVYVSESRRGETSTKRPQTRVALFVKLETLGQNCLILIIPNGPTLSVLSKVASHGSKSAAEIRAHI